MIPLYKLEKLPRTQKLRKIAKIFASAENRLCMAAEKNAAIFTNAEIDFFTQAARLLAKDDLFPPEAGNLFSCAADIFEVSLTAGEKVTCTQTAAAADMQIFQRALNNIKHVLLSQTGRDQADWDFINTDGQLDLQKRKIFSGMQIYMEDIRSPFNIGAMFRTAESFGVEKIILSPFSADPNHTRAKRTAMGCIEIIPWERRNMFSGDSNLQETQNDLKRGLLPVFALETGGIPLAEFSFPRRGIMIAGSEELGVSPQALAAADASLGRLSIPCFGAKASLNVSVAFGIALHAWAAYLQDNSL